MFAFVLPPGPAPVAALALFLLGALVPTLAPLFTPPTVGLTPLVVPVVAVLAPASPVPPVGMPPDRPQVFVAGLPAPLVMPTDPPVIIVLVVAPPVVEVEVPVVAPPDV
jgi:hypothetical protein